MTGRENIRILLILVGLNVLPHLVNVNWWVGAVAGVLWLLRWGQLYGQVPESGRWFRTLTVIGLTASVYFQHQTLLGVEASTDLLVLMVMVKTFEIRKYKDVMILAYLCFYLLMAKALDSQSVTVTLFLIADVFLIVAAMTFFHSAQTKRKWMGIFRQAISLSLLGIPLAVILFVVFPRFSTGWGQGGEEQPGLTGFADRLHPGDLAKLRLSDEVIFRATISNRSLPTSDLYWRGAVLDEARGLNWSRSSGEMEVLADGDYFPRSGALQQQIVMEPTYERWLFALDVPAWLRISGSWGVGASRDMRGFFLADRPIANKVHYQVWSTESIHKQEDDLSPYLALELDPETTSKTREWVKSLNLEQSSSKARVHFFLRYFQKQGFVYSLEPGLLTGLDQFIFEVRSGFCEHYAATLGTLLRMVGVPSRVVIGFQGGTPSLAGDYVLVRALDAHAWVEYWSGETWERVDPVAYVAPARIELGSLGYEEYLNQRQINDVGVESSLSLSSLGRFLKKLYFDSTLLWDQADAMWVQFLFRFDYQYQRELLSHLAGSELSRGQLFMLLLLLLALLLVRIYFRLTRGEAVTGSLRLYRLLCRRLKRWGWERQPQEGPLSFEARILKEDPAWGAHLESIFAPLVQARYGPTNISRADQLRLLVRILLLRRP